MDKTTYSLPHINEVAQTIVSALASPVVLFVGPMGAGKTTLIKAICNHLGVQDEVSSPTFALVNEYLDGHGESVFHFDMYRITDQEEALDFGIEEYFDSGQLCLVEWPQNVQALWPDKFGLIYIELDGEERRLQFFPNCTFETMPKQVKL